MRVYKVQTAIELNNIMSATVLTAWIFKFSVNNFKKIVSQKVFCEFC